VSLTCPNSWEACDVFVNVYSNCATSDTDGGLPYNLQGDDWKAGGCGPSFCLSFNDTCQTPNNNGAVIQQQDTHIKFRMKLFHKQFAGGDEIILPQLVSEPTMYFTTFVKEGRMCSGDKTESECLEQPGVCKWDSTNKCYPEICPPQAPTPPATGAQQCCDIAPGVEAGKCDAAATAITSVCRYNLPTCS